MIRSLEDTYNQIRDRTERLCKDLHAEDTVVQAEEFASPPKWHLAHSTWFFETFVLKPHLKSYKEYHQDFAFLFNSYYEHEGDRIGRNKRGLLSRPLLEEVYAYRSYVNTHMKVLLQSELSESLKKIIELGLQHEQQHQELLVTDTKYLFFCNPTHPKWKPQLDYELMACNGEIQWLPIEEGLVSIGFEGERFCFDNELQAHKFYLRAFSIANRPVSNAEYLEFINSGAYNHFSYWLAEGWDWVRANHVEAPLYWKKIGEDWFSFGFEGLEKLNLSLPIMHINYYEADAFARWMGLRLATEQEFETAAKLYPAAFQPSVWQWTQSAYLSYPGFKVDKGAVGEYNGKFMVNQMVLRGSSIATPKDHARVSYRNFFHPNLRWQFSGIRLVKDNH